MFRTSIAVTLLAILICSNAQGQTTAQKKSGVLQNWWKNQTAQYAQRNRSRFQRTQSTQQQRRIVRRPIRQVAAETKDRTELVPAPPAPSRRRSAPATVHVPGRGTVRVVPQPPRSPAAAPARVTQQVPVQRATAPLRPVPVHPVSMAHASQMYYSGGAPSGAMSFGTYPQTGASLYPSPLPNVPYQVGGTAITNQAFYPHEMLYTHKYKDLYGPYYYRVNGTWDMTPFGMWSHEDWKVEGTEVEVEYRSHISPFAGFKPPFTR